MLTFIEQVKSKLVRIFEQITEELFPEPYSYKIEEGVDRNGSSVFVVRLFLPEHDLGWVYLQFGNHITDDIDWAKRHPSRSSAERHAESAAKNHREMDAKNDIRWR